METSSSMVNAFPAAQRVAARLEESAPVIRHSRHKLGRVFACHRPTSSLKDAVSRVVQPAAPQERTEYALVHHHSSHKAPHALAHRPTSTSSTDSVWTNVQSTKHELRLLPAHALTSKRSLSLASACPNARQDTSATTPLFVRPSVCLAPISTFPTACACPESRMIRASPISPHSTRRIHLRTSHNTIPSSAIDVLLLQSTSRAKIRMNISIIRSTLTTTSRLEQLASCQRVPPSPQTSRWDSLVF